jgi:hypothetical protein
MFNKVRQPPIGKDRETPSDEHTPNSAHTTTANLAASDQVERLFNLVPPLDVGDPEEFFAAAIALFAQYPIEVTERAVFKIAELSDRPTLRLMRSVLEEILAPIVRARSNVGIGRCRNCRERSGRPSSRRGLTLRLRRRARRARGSYFGGGIRVIGNRVANGITTPSSQFLNGAMSKARSTPPYCGSTAQRPSHCRAPTARCGRC